MRSPVGLVKTQSLILQVWSGTPRMYISKESSSEADTAGPGTTSGEPLLYYAVDHQNQPLGGKQRHFFYFIKMKTNTDAQNKRAREAGFYFSLCLVPSPGSFLTHPLGGDLCSGVTLPSSWERMSFFRGVLFSPSFSSCMLILNLISPWNASQFSISCRFN